MVRNALAVRGHDPQVERLALNWQGLDLQYVLLRDFLEHRGARLVIWNMPMADATSDRPHVQAFRWFRYGEFRDALQGLPFRSRAALYGAFVLGAPRQFWTLLRPNRVFPEEIELAERSKAVDEGYYGAPFVEESAAPPAHPAGAIRITGPPLGSYNLHFARLTIGLLKERQIPVAFLHIPSDGEQADPTMPERMDWPRVLGIDAPVVGAASAALFAEVPTERFLRFYYDQHVNRNGQRLYTEAMLPEILRLYDNATRAH
jgi:hypothetical protein